ncbi:Ankyrin repeat-containing protein [Mycena sanguinolenta]|uniref:Ankyrin repeat-containing protein n=1 Tax=Mycena sanguinolenta TaxID=230812 RepID=A0A8H6YUR2_9AGAR|nr:Ankyrin repeat-containing protein [Mycena sanguinolenta]
MHPAVEIHNIHRLPPSQRRVALAACGSNPSLDDLSRVEMLAKKADIYSQNLYLPVFYNAINPARIPTSEELESLQPHTTARIACASLSVRNIFRFIKLVKTPQAYRPTLWPRVWAWIYFLHEHLEYFSPSITLSQMEIYSEFLVFAGQVDGFGADESFLSSTSGFRVVLAKAWSFLTQLKASAAHFEVPVSLGGFLGRLDFADPIHFREIIDGVGGTLDDLARLSLNYLDVMILRNDSENIGTPALRLHGLAVFIRVPGCCGGHQQSSLHEEFLETLRRFEFVPPFVNAMNVLLATPRSDNIQSACLEAFHLLIRLLYTPLAYRLLPPAISIGLLRMMANVATRFGPAVASYLRTLLTNILPNAMVYYHVVAAIDEVLVDIKEICYNEHFRALKIFEDWDAFIKLADRRIQSMRQNSSELKACDNLDCGKIQAGTQCRRCSGCKSVYYCNQECQMVDWRRGGHRNHCGSYTVLSLSKFWIYSGMTFRERQYLRKLLHDDYMENIYSICERHLALMASNPDVLLLTLFDYTVTPVEISVQPVADSLLAATLNTTVRVEWTNILDRVRNSHGRMHLHVMRVPEGNTPRTWVIPLRASNSRVHDALCELAKNYHAEDVPNKLADILGNDRDIVEIH